MKYQKTTALGLALSILLACGVTMAFAASPAAANVPQSDEGAVRVGGGDTSNQVFTNAEELGYLIGEAGEIDAKAIEGRKVDIDTSFTIEPGKYFERKFDMKNWPSSPHNALNIVISNTSGSKYYILLLNNEGLEYRSVEGGTYVNFASVSTTVTYTLRIVNTETKTLTGHITISSYYN